MRQAQAPSGLASSAARTQLARDGYNELPSERPRSLWRVASDVLREPMLLLLIAAASIYLVLGELGEALVLVASVFVVIAIALFQRRKTERALDALRELASPRAQVLRDGVWQRIAARELVRGDVVLVKEGDRIPADALLFDSTNVSVDESLLTGESVPVRKRSAQPGVLWERPGGDDSPFLYSGSLVTQGQGMATVAATGTHTEIGRIGRVLENLLHGPTPMEHDTRRAVVIFASIGLALCIAVTLLFGLLRGDWLQGLLAGITLAMANLPEEMPLVLTIFLALGAWRISQHGVLTRRSAAIEALGAATVLCVDKTGTLTQNRMQVAALWMASVGWRAGRPGSAPPPAELLEVLRVGVLACEREPFDPMEKALLDCVASNLPGFAQQHATWSVAHVYPLSPTQLSVAYVWRAAGEDHLFVAAKGAPEAIAALCDLDPRTRGVMGAVLGEMARDGLRVLAVARGVIPGAAGNRAPWPVSQQKLPLQFVGLAALQDPVRPSVPAAIRAFRGAGVRVAMITGDHAVTAQAIASQIGLDQPDRVITGREIEGFELAQLRSRAASVSVYARVVPEQKLKLIEALKAGGETVAMTGDGVNDAPALKAAHIGIAMGRRGSDVAREAADLVLLEDDFSAIVAAVRLGRRIFDNIQKAMTYIVAVHVPTAGMAVLPLLLGWPLVLYPVHIVFLEFVIDPACSIAFEAEPAERNVMHRPPRRRDVKLFDVGTLGSGIAQGVGVLVGVAAVYGLALAAGAAEGQARAMAFTGIVIGNISLILGNRSRHASLWRILRTHNPALWIVITGALAGLAAVLTIPPVQHLFRFEALGAQNVAIGAAATLPGLAVLAILEALKWFRGRRASIFAARRPAQQDPH
jgi:P-type Ca2+ transporter type 2C